MGTTEIMTTEVTTEALVADALAQIGKIDLRTVRNPELRGKLKNARAELKEVRMGLRK